MTVGEALKLLEGLNISKTLKWKLIEIKISCGKDFIIDSILEEEILTYLIN
jgi:hypothetical protein